MIQKILLKRLNLWRIFIIFLVVLTFLPTFAIAEETYEFERMWPTLQQPWYFYQSEAVEVNKDGYIFVADTWQNRIVKLAPNGEVIKSVGVEGSEPGNFNMPGGITIDKDGFIYVAERNNHRIQKFTADLEFVETWPSAVNPSSMGQPEGGLAVDNQGYIYHADYHDDHIYKYRSDGTLVQQWGSSGTGTGEFNRPVDIAIDQENYIYITDYLNHRVQKFTSDGKYLDQWGHNGSGPGEFSSPKGITVDKDGYVYVCDSPDCGDGRIQKFTKDGDYITHWMGINVETYEGGATGIAANSQGVLYVTTQRSVMSFTSTGVFVERWGSRGTGPGEFQWPSGVAKDSHGYVYISDNDNGKITKFDSYGNYIGDWPAAKVNDMTIINDIVYVSQTWNKMSTFTTNGELIKDWEVAELIFGFDLDSNGNIYAAVRRNSETGSVDGIVKYDSNGVIVNEKMIGWVPDVSVDVKNNLVYALYDDGYKKYDTNLNLLETYNSYGDDNGQFKQPECITVDDAGNIYIGDIQRHDIQQLSLDGFYLAKIGEPGTDPGKFNSPHDIWVDKAGNVYTVEFGNVRVQKFKKIVSSKAMPWIPLLLLDD
jgi:streptogramin lyase